MKKPFYEKAVFRNTLLISLPVLMSLLGLFISQTTNNNFKIFLVIIGFILTAIIAIAVLIFSRQEEKKEKHCEDLEIKIQDLTGILMHMENQYQTNLYTMLFFSAFFDTWAKNIHTFILNANKYDKVSDKAWNKIEFMDTICLQCKRMIERYCNKNDESKVSVGFVSCREDETGEKWVHMISHSNPNSTRPNCCKEECKLSECLYHYGDLIKARMTDIEVAVNTEEILRIFRAVSIGNNLEKYTQYIAIPVYCKNILLGVFQIVTKYDYYIEQEKSALIEFATKNVIPYSNAIALIDSIYKGLYRNINPEQINKEE